MTGRELVAGARAIVFDLDGTLADTLGDLASAMNHALASLGLPTHEPPAYKRMIGDGAGALARRAMGSAPAELHDEVLARFRRRYAEALVVDTAPYPGVPELLDACVARAVRMAILSNKPDAPTREIAARLFGRWPWSSIRGESPGTPRKPDPTAALAIAAACAVEPGRCLLVGDSASDMRTATAAGMIGVGAAWGFRDAHELHAAGAGCVLECPEELLGMLG